jgi:putative sporulation protein YyaC
MLSHLFSDLHSHEHKYHINQPQTIFQIGRQIYTFATRAKDSGVPIALLCIGTDRSTGDALGPLTGAKLQLLHKSCPIFGTLDDPVHATNLLTKLDMIHQQFPQAFIIAIDACLGKLDNVGSVTIGRGSLKPGAAVNKDLPSVGDAYITGVVNVGGFMEHMVLQSTRLSLVMKMADTIAHGVSLGLRQSPPPPLFTTTFQTERQAE